MSTKAELYEQATALDIEGRSTMTKDELEEAIAAVSYSEPEPEPEDVVPTVTVTEVKVDGGSGWARSRWVGPGPNYLRFNSSGIAWYEVERDGEPVGDLDALRREGTWEVTDETREREVTV